MHSYTQQCTFHSQLRIYIEERERERGREGEREREGGDHVMTGDRSRVG